MKVTHLFFLSLILVPFYSYAMDTNNDREEFKKITVLLKEKKVFLGKIEDTIKVEHPTKDLMIWLNREERESDIITQVRDPELKDILPAITQGFAIGTLEEIIEESLNFFYNFTQHKINRLTDDMINSFTAEYTDFYVLSSVLSYGITYCLVPNILPEELKKIFTKAGWTSGFTLATYKDIASIPRKTVNNAKEATIELLNKICKNEDLSLTFDVLKNYSLESNPGEVLENISPNSAKFLQCCKVVENSESSMLNPGSLYNHITGGFYSFLNLNVNSAIKVSDEYKTNYCSNIGGSVSKFFSRSKINEFLEESVLPNIMVAKKMLKLMIRESVNKNIPDKLNFEEVKTVFEAQGKIIGKCIIKAYVLDIAKENGVNIDDFIKPIVCQKSSEKFFCKGVDAFIKILMPFGNFTTHVKNCMYGNKTNISSRHITPSFEETNNSTGISNSTNNIKESPYAGMSKAELLEEEKKSIEINQHLGKRLYDEGDYKEALNCFKFAADKGDKISQTCCGKLYSNDQNKYKCVRQDYDQSLKYYDLAATQGDLAAMYNCGLIYERYFGFMKSDNAKAFSYYMSAAKGGHIDAMYACGLCYENGKGVEKNLEEASKYYVQASDGGSKEAKDRLIKCKFSDPNAQYILGQAYENGDAVEKNLEEAVKCYVQAAIGGNKEALNCFKQMYINGKQGCPKNSDDKINYFKFAANQNYPGAKNFLGAIYNDKQDYAEAFNCFEDAAKIGDSKAMYNCHLCYWHGKGVKASAIYAVGWYLRAAWNGQEDTNSFVHMPLKLCQDNISITIFCAFAFSIWGILYSVGLL